MCVYVCVCVCMYVICVCVCLCVCVCVWGDINFKTGVKDPVRTKNRLWSCSRVLAQCGSALCCRFSEECAAFIFIFRIICSHLQVRFICSHFSVSTIKEGDDAFENSAKQHTATRRKIQEQDQY